MNSIERRVISAREWLAGLLRGPAASVILGIAYGAFLCCCAPLGKAFEFGVNEGFELMKGFLCSSGHVLYAQVWSDQPPMHTGLLALLFKLFGPSILAARLLGVGFAALLTGTLYELVRRSVGHCGALTSFFILLAWPMVMRLHVSVLTDTLVMAFGLLSSLLLIAGIPIENAVSGEPRRGHIRMKCLIASGLMMGLALQTKLTAGIFFPAIAVHFAAGTSYWGIQKGWESKLSHLWRAVLVPALVWTLMIVAAAGLVWMFFPAESSHDLLQAHFSKGTRAAMDEQPGYSFQVRSLWREWNFLIPAVGGVIYLLAKRQKGWFFPVIFFATVSLVHSFHRPYWPHYALHFALATAWLAGTFAGRLWQSVTTAFRHLDNIAFPSFNALRAIFAWLLVIVMVAFGLPDRLHWAWHSIVWVKLRCQEEKALQELQAGSGHVLWIFSDQPIYAFHARRLVPPELAVVSDKRFWSRQITLPEIKSTLERYRPDKIYILNSIWLNELADLLESEYQLKEGANIYVRRAAD